MKVSPNIVSHKIYNVGTGKNYSMTELAELIQDKPDIKFIPPRPAEVTETLADIKETIKDLKWNPKFDLPDVINRY